MKTILLLGLFAVLTLSQSCCNDNTISVSGNADVLVKPDIAKFTVNVEDTQRTTSQALTNVNDKIASIISILKRNNIAEKDYSTSSFSIYSDYDYSSGEKILTGQRASQSLTVTVRQITQDGSFIGKLITSISQIKGATINGVSFEQSDDRLGVKSARKAAYESAKKKAQEYANLSELYLGQALRIEAVSGGNIVPFFA